MNIETLLSWLFTLGLPAGLAIEELIHRLRVTPAPRRERATMRSRVREATHRAA
jgi:hypothetical protein